MGKLVHSRNIFGIVQDDIVELDDECEDEELEGDDCEEDDEEEEGDKWWWETHDPSIPI